MIRNILTSIILLIAASTVYADGNDFWTTASDAQKEEAIKASEENAKSNLNIKMHGIKLEHPEPERKKGPARKLLGRISGDDESESKTEKDPVVKTADPAVFDPRGFVKTSLCMDSAQHRTPPKRLLDSFKDSEKENKHIEAEGYGAPKGSPGEKIVKGIETARLHAFEQISQTALAIKYEGGTISEKMAKMNTDLNENELSVRLEQLCLTSPSIAENGDSTIQFKIAGHEFLNLIAESLKADYTILNAENPGFAEKTLDINGLSTAKLSGSDDVFKNSSAPDSKDDKVDKKKIFRKIMLGNTIFSAIKN